MEDFTKLDKIIEVALINLFTLSKETHTVRLTNFSFRNRAHLSLLFIGLSMRSLFNFKLELHISLIQYIFYRLKYNCLKFWKRTSNSIGIDVNDFINHIEEANDSIGIFNEIYTNYYERKKEK